MAHVQPKLSIDIGPVNHGKVVKVTGGRVSKAPDGGFMVALTLLVGDGVYMPLDTFDNYGAAAHYIQEAKERGVSVA